MSQSTPFAAPPGPFGPAPVTAPGGPAPLTPAQIERRWIGDIVAVVVPGMLARRLLRPKYRIGRPDPTMATVNRVRGWLGLFVVLSVFLAALYDRDKKATGAASLPANGTGGVPGLPSGGVPSMPSLPSMPSMPSLPSMPGMPTFPSMPTLPGMPTLPTVPGGTGGTGGTGGIPGVSQVPQVPQSKAAVRADEGVQVVFELMSALIKRVILLPIYGALGVVVVGALLVLSTHPHLRALTIRQLWYPVRSIVVFTVVPAIGFGAMWLCRKGAGMDEAAGILRTDGSTADLVLSWIAAVLSLWCFWFGLVAVWQVTRHLFSAVDGHPLMPALLAMWLAWTFTATDLFVTSDSWLFTAGDIVPDHVKGGIGIIGSAIITALAYWEIDRLRRWNGITMRSGPYGRLAPPLR